MMNSPYILVVDDDRPIVRYAKRVLDNGYTVTGSSSANDALAAMKKCLPDLLILDLNMPEPDGFDFLRNERSKFPYLRILVISGYLHGVLLEAATLEKPFTAEALITK